MFPENNAHVIYFDFPRNTWKRVLFKMKQNVWRSIRCMIYMYICINTLYMYIYSILEINLASMVLMYIHVYVTCTCKCMYFILQLFYFSIRNGLTIYHVHVYCTWWKSFVEPCIFMMNESYLHFFFLIQASFEDFYAFNSVYKLTAKLLFTEISTCSFMQNAC